MPKYVLFIQIPKFYIMGMKPVCIKPGYKVIVGKSRGEVSLLEQDTIENVS